MKPITCGPGWAFVKEHDNIPVSVSNPNSPKPKIRLEKRSGKKVSVITGLQTYGTDRLNEIAKKLKVICGSGGTVKNGAIEIQGDKTQQILSWFNTLK